MDNDKDLSWKAAVDDLNANVERSLSSIRASILSWEHDSSIGLVAETNTLLSAKATSGSGDIVIGEGEDVDVRLQVKPPLQLDVAFEEMSDLLDQMQEEEQQQELWLQNLERMLVELQHITKSVETERETFQAQIAHKEVEQETSVLWRSMYFSLKERYYEDLRRQVDETEIQITLDSNVPVSFLRPDPCQHPAETVPGIGIRVKASGNLTEVAPSLSAIRFQSPGREDVRLSIQLKLQNHKVPGLNRFDATNE